MGKEHRATSTCYTLSAAEFNYYRATPKGRAAATCAYIKDRSLYLYDVLDLCKRGIWERELRQFMPAASLQASVNSLLALGLIECVDDAQQLLAA